MKKQVVLLVLLVIGSLVIGRYSFVFEDVLSRGTITYTILWSIRAPRVIFVCMSGAALALSGYIFQTMFRNPLASGDVIGAASGCSLGAALAIISSSSVLLLQLSSFLGGVLAVSLCLGLYTKLKQQGHGVHLVILGLVIQSLFNAMLMVIKIIADPQRQLSSIEYWLMGGFSDITWSKVLIAGVIIAFAMVVVYLMRWNIQLLTFGDEAKTLGMASHRVVSMTLLLATLMVSTVISFAGVVSFVGLLVPHVVRQRSPLPFTKNIGLTVVTGANFLMLCDLLARSLFTIELPISIPTSFIGACLLLIYFVRGKVTL